MRRAFFRLCILPAIFIGLAIMACNRSASLPATPPPFDLASTATDIPATPTDIPLTPTEIAVTETPAPTPTAAETPTPSLSQNAIDPETLGSLQPVMKLTGHNGAVHAVAVSPDGSLIVAAGFDTKVRIFDGLTGDLLHTLERHRDWVYSLAFSPDGTRLVSGGRDRTIQIWDPVSGERIIGARMSAEIADLDFAPDDIRFAAVGFYSSLGEVWDTNGSPLFMLEGHDTRLRSVAYTGQLLATGDANGVLILHDTVSGNAIAELGQAGGEILTMDFSPDGSTLAVGTAQHNIQLWDVQALEMITSWSAHSSQVWSLVYTPDGRLIISGGADATVRVWDAATGEKLAGLAGHGAAVRSVALSRDGATLASGGEDNQVLVWRVIR